MVRVSVLYFLQCFVTDSFVIRRTSQRFCPGTDGGGLKGLPTDPGLTGKMTIKQN